MNEQTHLNEMVITTFYDTVEVVSETLCESSILLIKQFNKKCIFETDTQIKIEDLQNNLEFLR